MKNILALIVLVLTLVACDQSYEYIKPDIEEVEVYQIIENNHTINIYKNQDIVIQSKGIKSTKEVITERGEITEEDPFNMTLTTFEQKDETIMREIEVENEEGEMVMEETIIEVLSTYTYSYIVSGDSEAGTGSAEITTTNIKRIGKEIEFTEEETPNTAITVSGSMKMEEILN